MDQFRASCLFRPGALGGDVLYEQTTSSVFAEPAVGAQSYHTSGLR